MEHPRARCFKKLRRSEFFTETATLAKIDPDNSSADDLGPSIIKCFTPDVRHQFSFGTLQGIVSKADAGLQTFNGVAGTVTPEAPRTILDVLTTLDKLPLGLQARAEYDYVGHKFLGVRNSDRSAQYEAVPVTNTNCSGELVPGRPIGGRSQWPYRSRRYRPDSRDFCSGLEHRY